MKNLKNIFATACFFFICVMLSAQGAGGPIPPPSPPPTAEGGPIDAGAICMLLAVSAVGFYAIRAKRAATTVA